MLGTFIQKSFSLSKIDFCKFSYWNWNGH